MNIDMVQTAALAVIALYVGELIKRRSNFLEKYCIPSPVVGGLSFAILFLILKQLGFEFTLDTTLQNLFMNMFFTTVGFTASLKLLNKSGLPVLVFLGVSILLIFLQNGLGVVLAGMFKLNPLMGLATGSIPLVGGIGTSGAFGPLLEKAGAEGATTVAVASATFGMIVGNIIGNPLAKKLIESHGLAGTYRGDESINLQIFSESAVAEELDQVSGKRMYSAFALVFLAMGLGTIISSMFQKMGLTFPSYIGAMFAAAIIRNLGDFSGKFKVPEDEIKVTGDITLSIFLAIAMMSLKLWQLKGLALPLIVILAFQTLLMILVAYFITFNAMGRDYEAAVLTSGHCGFGMGATSNAMANMRALTEQYGPAPRAFFVVPLVGSLFIDFFNAFIIVLFMNMVK
ncbi:MAG: sodium/glutamate symporter [Bacillota bacterium]